MKTDVERAICKCRIRGVLEIYKVRTQENVWYRQDFYDSEKFLRKFKYCPLCGKKLDKIRRKGQ